MSNLCLVLMVKGEEWNSTALRLALGVAKILASFLGAWAGRVLLGGFANRSGNSSSSELKSSSSSSSEPRITVSRFLTADVGAGGDEQKRSGDGAGAGAGEADGEGDGDGGGGVGDASTSGMLGWELCDVLGAGLKKLVMAPFLGMSGFSRHYHLIMWFRMLKSTSLCLALEPDASFWNLTRVETAPAEPNGGRP